MATLASFCQRTRGRCSPYPTISRAPPGTPASSDRRKNCGFIFMRCHLISCERLIQASQAARTVNHQKLAVHVGGLGAGKELEDVRDVFRRADPTRRNP